jgi:hypothetical protein
MVFVLCLLVDDVQFELCLMVRQASASGHTLCLFGGPCLFPVIGCCL